MNTFALDTFPWREFAIAAAFVGAGVAAGLFAERVLLRWLDALARRTKWRADNVIFRSIRGIPVFWGFAAGLYVGRLYLAPGVAEEGSAFLEAFETVLLVAVLWSLTIIAARIASGLTTTYANRENTFLPMTSLIPTLVRLFVYSIGTLIVLNALGVSIAPLLTALGVGGLAVALALQDTLSNVFAGLYLIASGQIKAGDYLRLEGGEEGYVRDINWRSTTLRTVLDNQVIVPNAKLASSIVLNYHLERRPLRVRIPVAVDYESDLRHVERVTLAVAREVIAVVSPRLQGQEPEVYLHTFGEFSLNLTVILPVEEFYQQHRLRHEFMIRLIERYRQEGIRIPFPIKEFEMELSTEGLDAGRPGRLQRPDRHEGPAEGGAL